MKALKTARSITARFLAFARSTNGSVNRRTGCALLFGFLASTAALPAAATVILYTASLSGAQENPPVTSAGTGFTTVTYDDVAHSLRVQATFSGLNSNTTAAHIHIWTDPATRNGGVATQTPSFVGFPLGVTSGSFDSTYNLTLASNWNAAFITANGGSPAGAESAFITGLNDGRGYFNVHTTTSPTGEIRGNLTRVPEPATWVMLSTALGLVCVVRRRQSRRFALA